MKSFFRHFISFNVGCFQEFSRSHGFSHCAPPPPPPQMLGEPFTRRHTSRREWCSSSTAKVSLPSWPPSSRSPPRQESSSPSMNPNTGNPAVILPACRPPLLLVRLYLRASPSISGWKWNPETNLRIAAVCRKLLMWSTRLYCQSSGGWQGEREGGIMHRFLLRALAGKIRFNVLYL